MVEMSSRPSPFHRRSTIPRSNFWILHKRTESLPFLDQNLAQLEQILLIHIGARARTARRLTQLGIVAAGDERTRVSGKATLICLVAASPSISFILMSIKTQSGRCCV